VRVPGGNTRLPPPGPGESGLDQAPGGLGAGPFAQSRRSSRTRAAPCTARDAG